MNTPVSFEIAKLLEEKGFDEPCSHAYKEFESPVLYIHQDKKYNNSFKKEWQNTVRKNSSMNNARIKRYSAPTIAEVVMWLYEKHGIWINVGLYVHFGNVSKFQYSIDCQKFKPINSIVHLNTNPFNLPTEAYEAAIKYTLNNLT